MFQRCHVSSRDLTRIQRIRRNTVEHRRRQNPPFCREIVKALAKR
jgi:hypothetical protein